MTHWKGQRVLVTGATGFLGSNVCWRLGRLGAEVYGLCRTTPSTDPSVRSLIGDLRDPGVFKDCLQKSKAEVIIHLAGQTSADLDNRLVLTTFQDNVVTTVNVLNETVDIGCRRVLVTASLEEPEMEDWVAIPSSPYAASKVVTGVYGRMFHALYDLPVVTVRPYMTYGPRQRVGKLVPYVTLSLLRQIPPRILSPERRADWVYVDDVVDGILAAIQVPNLEGRTIDLGSGKAVSVREVTQELVAITGSRAVPLYPQPLVVDSAQVRVANVAEAQKILGWSPKTSLLDGLTSTVAWYKSHQLAPAPQSCSTP